MITLSTIHPCGKKKINLKLSKKLCATTVQSKEFNDPCKKNVFSPPFPAGRCISLAQNPLLGMSPTSPGSSLLSSFLRLHPISSHFPTLARGNAGPGAQVSEGHQSFNSEEARPSSAGELLDTGEAEAELSQAG